MLGYGIDSVQKVMLQKFEFNDTFDSFVWNTSQNVWVNATDRLESVTALLTALDSSTSKGYLPHHDLSKFPVISEVLPYF